MKQHLSLLLFLFLPVSLCAQINESDSLDVKADLSLTGFWQEGNVETVIFRARSDFSARLWRRSVFKTTNSYVYQEFGNQKADEDILSLNFFYLNPSRKVHPFVLGFVSTNFRREIGLRYLLGSGFTFQILQKKKDWLKVSLSGEYERTRFLNTNFNRSEYDGNRIIDTYRGTVWVSGRYHLFEDNVVVTHESYFQPSLEKRNNYRWRMDLGLELPIWDFLSFRINYLETFESIVIEGQNQEDRILTFGFTLKSY